MTVWYDLHYAKESAYYVPDIQDIPDPTLLDVVWVIGFIVVAPRSQEHHFVA